VKRILAIILLALGLAAGSGALIATAHGSITASAPDTHYIG
jgi:hypothetical protein